MSLSHRIGPLRSTRVQPLFSLNSCLFFFSLLILSPCDSHLQRGLEILQAFGTNNAFQVGLDEDHIGTFGHMREVLASLPEIVIHGAFGDRSHSNGNDIWEGSVVVEVGQEDANIKGMEEKWNTGSSLVERNAGSSYGVSDVVVG